MNEVAKSPVESLVLHYKDRIEGVLQGMLAFPSFLTAVLEDCQHNPKLREAAQQSPETMVAALLQAAETASGSWSTRVEIVDPGASSTSGRVGLHDHDPGSLDLQQRQQPVPAPCGVAGLHVAQHDDGGPFAQLRLVVVDQRGGGVGLRRATAGGSVEVVDHRGQQLVDRVE